MDASKMEELFAQTLVSDLDDDAAHRAIVTLQTDGCRETFEYAIKWLESEDPLKRARASEVLGQLSHPSHNPLQPECLFREEAFAAITKMLEHEQQGIVIADALTAIGHLCQPEAIPIVLSYLEHPDDEVRISVAFALGSYPEEPRSIEALLKLTTDPIGEVRDWAIFSLGVLGQADSPEIRSALLHGLADADEDVREEAAVSLGRRKEPQLIPVLKTMLQGPELKMRVAEAAAALLDLEEEPAGWTTADYKKALQDKFPDH